MPTENKTTSDAAQLSTVSFAGQLALFCSNFFRLEWRRKEKIITPIFIGISIILLFSFGLVDADASFRKNIFVTECLCASLIALQYSLTKSFDSESQDHVFSLLRTYPVNYFALFLSKLLNCMIFCILIMVPTVLIASLFNRFGGAGDIIYIMVTSILGILGLSGVGMLLTIMVLNAKGKELIFPVIFYPMVAPVLLCCTQFSLSVIDEPPESMFAFNEVQIKWLIILLIFDGIYLTLSYLFFAELMEP